MNRSDMSRQVLQPGTRVSIDSKGRRSEEPMGSREKSGGLAAGVREFTTGMQRREKAAGFKRGGQVKKPGKRYE